MLFKKTKLSTYTTYTIIIQYLDFHTITIPTLITNSLLNFFSITTITVCLSIHLFNNSKIIIIQKVVKREAMIKNFSFKKWNLMILI